MSKKPVPKGDIVEGNICKHLDRRFLSSLDLAGSEDISVKIDRVERHEKLTFANGNSSENALLLYFVGSDKPLLLNVTNIKAIIGLLCSNKVSDWHGKKIKLGVRKVKGFGKTVDAVRVIS